MQNTYRPWHLATFRTSKHIYGYVFFECHEHTLYQSTVFFECHVHTVQKTINCILWVSCTYSTKKKQSTVFFECHVHTQQQSTVLFPIAQLYVVNSGINYTTRYNHVNHSTAQHDVRAEPQRYRHDVGAVLCLYHIGTLKKRSQRLWL